MDTSRLLCTVRSNFPGLSRAKFATSHYLHLSSDDDSPSDFAAQLHPDFNYFPVGRCTCLYCIARPNNLLSSSQRENTIACSMDNIPECWPTVLGAAVSHYLHCFLQIQHSNDCRCLPTSYFDTHIFHISIRLPNTPARVWLLCPICGFHTTGTYTICT